MIVYQTEYIEQIKERNFHDPLHIIVDEDRKMIIRFGIDRWRRPADLVKHLQNIIKVIQTKFVEGGNNV